MITSASNSKVKELIKLREKAAYRRECGLYIIEGGKMVGEIPKEMLHSIYMSETYASREQTSSSWDGIDTEVLSDQVFSRVSDTVTPQGIMALVRRPKTELSELAKGGLILVAEGIQDPGNMGTIIRTAEACGADGILCDNATADCYSPKVVRSTMGAILRVPVAYTGGLGEAAEALKSRGYTTYAAHLQASVDYREAAFEPASAIMIGNESKGLSAELTEMADRRVIIPMKGKIESLNAAVAASLLMFEWVRRRD